MAKEYLYQDLIDQYFKGKLVGEALDKFKLKLKVDPEFARKVELQLLLIEEIKESRRKELKSFLTENARVDYIQNIWSTKWMYASAAIIILTLGTYFTLQRFNVKDKGIAHTEEHQKPKISESDKADKNELRKEEVGSDVKGDLTELEENKVETLTESSDEERKVELNDNGDLKYKSADVDSDGLKTNSEKATVSMKDLGAREKELASDDNEVVEKDSMTFQRVQSVTNLDLAKIKNIEQRDQYMEEGKLAEVTVKKQDKKKERGRKIAERRLKIEDQDSVDLVGTDEDFDAVNDNVVTAKTQKTPAQTITIQYWKSIVKYKGYRFDGSMLLLYGISQDDPISFKKYNQTLYMKHNGMFFVLISDKAFNKYKEVTDSELLKKLSE